MLKEKSYFKMMLSTAGILILCVNMTIAKTPPAPRDGAEIEKVLAKVTSPKELPEMNIVLLADMNDHGIDEHGYPLWQKRWALLLGGKNVGDYKETQVNLFGKAIGDYNEIIAGKNNVKVSTAWEWPGDEQFKSADVIVAYCYLNWNPQRLRQVEEYLSRGGGLVVVHPATWTKPEPSTEVAKLLGISGYKFYRHGIVDMKITAPDNPVCIGLPERIKFDDEAYWPSVIQTDIEILAASDEKGGDSNNITQAIFWTHTFGKGRVFGCQLGHNNWTFDDPYLRILLLRGIAWAGNQSPYRFDSLVMKGASLKTIKE
jgi:type 1 glutamine amidotransferase